MLHGFHTCVFWRSEDGVVERLYQYRQNLKSFKNPKHNRQEIEDIMSPILKTLEFWYVWGYGKRGKKVVGADLCITTRPYIAEVVQCLCLWLHERLRVRGHRSPYWIHFSSAACLLYYLCKESCFSTLFLSQQAWNVIKHMWSRTRIWSQPHK